jgi:hypothetical protein
MLLPELHERDFIRLLGETAEELALRLQNGIRGTPTQAIADGGPVQTWRESCPRSERLGKTEYAATKRSLQFELVRLRAELEATRYVPARFSYPPDQDEQVVGRPGAGTVGAPPEMGFSPGLEQAATVPAGAAQGRQIMAGAVLAIKSRYLARSGERELLDRQVRSRSRSSWPSSSRASLAAGTSGDGERVVLNLIRDLPAIRKRGRVTRRTAAPAHLPGSRQQPAAAVASPRTDLRPIAGGRH